MQRLPQLVRFREACFNLVCRKTLCDECLVTPPVTSVATYPLAEELFYSRDERLAGGEGKTCECNVGGGKTAI